MMELNRLITKIKALIEQVQFLQEAMQWVLLLSPDKITIFVVYYVLPALAVAFFGRTAITLILRTLGLSHPSHYRFWPRLPWRGVYQIRLRLGEWYEVVFKHSKIATGGFAGALSTLTQMYTPKKLFLGRAWAWGMALLQPIGMNITRHVFVYAMTGGGKTTWLISALQCWRGSAWLIDPKGQVTEALQRNDKRDWVVFNPYAPDTTAFFNPFDDIKAAINRECEGAAVKWAVRVAEALIITPSGSKTPYFTDTARGFVASLILHILSFHDEKDHNLGFMRELIVHGLRVVDENGELGGE
ncbi:MAG: type IV secretory system conjugative DNA transfer family protein, partial [Psychrosphaera sp.]|nr:type IV secretory system conjugative DNA transfer family protein [Psychrosphaera sp.]